MVTVRSAVQAVETRNIRHRTFAYKVTVRSAVQAVETQVLCLECSIHFVTVRSAVQAVETIDTTNFKMWQSKSQ